MKTALSNISISKSEDATSGHSYSEDFIEQRIHGLAKLSTLPFIASKVMEVVENPRTSASDLCKLISMDQVLAARILRLANSAYYGFPRKISTLNLAIVVLGFNALRDMVMSISIINRFLLNDDHKFELEQFWRHALIVGRGAKILAKYLNYPVAGEVFVAGLLHDIGYLIFLQEFPKDFERVYEFAQENDIGFREAEQLEWGYPHDRLGAWLAEGWNLPEKLARAIKYHHAPEKCPEDADFVQIIHLADLLAYSIGEGSGILRPEEEENYYAVLEEQFEEIIPRNNYPVSFFQDKFRLERDKVEEFLEIVNKGKLN